MANLPEAPIWRAGVAQLETTTPVRGADGSPDLGESNEPLLNLADRTAWLKTQVDALAEAVALRAPIASPDFTGTAQAATPPDGDNSRRLVTTEWVQAALRGALTKAIGNGNTNLTAVEAGRGVLIFIGTLSAAATVALPATTGRWVVVNRTTGNQTLTVRTLGGAGITLTQGRTQGVWSDGVDLASAATEANDLLLTGTPTAPTAGPTVATGQVATTAFARGFVRGATTIDTSAGGTFTLTDAQAQPPILALAGSPGAGVTVTFPAEGAVWVVVNGAGQAATLKTAAQVGGVVLQPGRAAIIAANGSIIVEAPSQSRDHALLGAPTATTPSTLAAGQEVVTAEWVRAFLAGQALYTTGDTKLTLKAVPDTGWLFLAGGSIGGAASGATTRANADTAALYALLWANLTDAVAPVAGGRGGSAAADFAANKALTLPDARGRAFVGAGAGAGLAARALGGTFGAEAHVLTMAQMPQHNHGAATGAAGAHGHTITVDGAGLHAHSAFADAQGFHSHGASTDTQGLHAHSGTIATGPLGGFHGYQGFEEGRGDPDWPVGAMPAAGAHQHNISVQGNGFHGHNITIANGGTHAHTASAAVTPDHQHIIPAQGSGEAHTNMQPSIALNVMVKL